MCCFVTKQTEREKKNHVKWSEWWWWSIWLVGLVNFYCKLYSLWLFETGGDFLLEYIDPVCAFVVCIWTEISSESKMHGRDLVVLIFIRPLPHAAENHLFWLILGFFSCYSCCYCRLDMLLSYIIEWDSNNINAITTQKNSPDERPEQQYIAWMKEKKNWIENFTFCSVHKMLLLSHDEWKNRRISILFLNPCKSQRLFSKKKDVKVWSNLIVQKADKKKSFNGDSMYCLPTARQTDRPSPKWNSNQLREFEHNESKTFYPIHTISRICLYW